MFLTLAQYDVLEHLAKFGPMPTVVLHAGATKALARKGLVILNSTGHYQITDAGRAAIAPTKGGRP